jgi:hypothetical protein
MNINHDFDFLFGTWTTQNSFLKQRLVGCTEWITFCATMTAYPILGGLGNMDDFIAPDWRANFIGMTLRLFNPATEQWSIYWMSNTSGTLEPPVMGSFKDGIGIFEGDDTLNGIPIRVRFTWTVMTKDLATWEQEFSSDNGVTWEKNWIMRHTRVATS